MACCEPINKKYEGMYTKDNIVALIILNASPKGLLTSGFQRYGLNYRLACRVRVPILAL